MPRFVILCHEPSPSSPRRLHWDLMLENGEDVLLTWALEREPVLDVPIPAERLADHRRHYLDYEGPLSADRGSVRRWDAGEFELLRRTDHEFALTMAGDNIRGQAYLRRVPAEVHRWVVTFSREPSSVGRWTTTG